MSSLDPRLSMSPLMGLFDPLLHRQPVITLFCCAYKKGIHRSYCLTLSVGIDVYCSNDSGNVTFERLGGKQDRLIAALPYYLGNIKCLRIVAFFTLLLTLR